MILRATTIAKPNSHKASHVYLEADSSIRSVTYRVVGSRLRNMEVSRTFSKASAAAEQHLKLGHQGHFRQVQLDGSTDIKALPAWAYLALGINDFQPIRDMLAAYARKPFSEDPDQWQARLYFYAEGQDMEAGFHDLMNDPALLPVDLNVNDALLSLDQSHMSMPGFGAWA